MKQNVRENDTFMSPKRLNIWLLENHEPTWTNEHWQTVISMANWASVRKVGWRRTWGLDGPRTLANHEVGGALPSVRFPTTDWAQGQNSETTNKNVKNPAKTSKNNYCNFSSVALPSELPPSLTRFDGWIHSFTEGMASLLRHPSATWPEAINWGDQLIFMESTATNVNKATNHWSTVLLSLSLFDLKWEWEELQDSKLLHRDDSISGWQIWHSRLNIQLHFCLSLVEKNLWSCIIASPCPQEHRGSSLFYRLFSLGCQAYRFRRPGPAPPDSGAMGKSPECARTSQRAKKSPEPHKYFLRNTKHWVFGIFFKFWPIRLRNIALFGWGPMHCPDCRLEGLENRTDWWHPVLA